MRGSGEQQQRLGALGNGLTDLRPLCGFDGVVDRPPSLEVMALVEYRDVLFLVEILESIEDEDAVR